MATLVKFEVDNSSCAEYISCLIENDFVLNTISREKHTMTAVCRRDEYKYVAKIARKFGYRTRVIKKKGIYFKINRWLKRKGIFAGVLLFFVLNLFFSKMIWRVEINCIDNDVKNSIAATLFDNNVYAGTFYDREKMEKLKHNIMLDISGVSYVAFNFYKGYLECEIYTVNKRENYTDTETDSNIYARLSGVITDLRVYRGFSRVQPGQSVTVGDVLVSNITTTKHEYTASSRTAAYIEGICRKKYSVFIPFDKKVQLLTGEKITDKYLFFNGRQYEIKKDKKQGNYSKRSQIKSLNVFGFMFPITVKTDTYYTLSDENIIYDEMAAMAKGKTRLDIMISTDVKLKEKLSQSYDYAILTDGVQVICETEGRYEMT